MMERNQKSYETCDYWLVGDQNTTVEYSGRILT